MMRLFSNTAALISSYFPKASKADVIPGFPGKKDEDFLNTIKLIMSQLSFLLFSLFKATKY